MADAPKTLMPRLVALGFAVLALAVIVGFARGVTTPLWSSKSADDTRLVLAAIEDLRSETDRAESRQWAYFLTRDRMFLAERDVALAAVDAALQALVGLTIDNSEQQLVLKKLGAAVDQRESLLSNSQLSLENLSTNDVAALTRSGRVAGEAVRAILGQFEGRERELLATRQASEYRKLQIVFTSFAFMLTCIAVLALRQRRRNLALLAHERISRQASEAAARDFTAQRLASQYARSLIEASLDPLVTISPDGKIMDVNGATVKVTGVPREELLGSDFSSYFTEPAKAQDGYLRVFAEGFVADYALTIRHRDGKLTDVLYNASVYKDVEGQVLGVFAAARDITAQKQASQYARSLIEASLDPLVTISPDGKIMDVNGATVKVTGVPREELLGSDFLSYFTEPAKAQDGYQRVFAEGFVADYPLTIRQRSGKLTDVLYNASVYRDVAGNVLGVFAAARDITERKIFEKSLNEHNVELKTAKTVAEQANLAKSEFLSSMSHELRTPLNAVLGFAQLIDSSPQTMTAAQKLSINEILKAGWHLLNLINEILDLAVIESGKASMSMEPVSLYMLLQDCQSMIEPLAEKRRIQMTFPSDDQAYCVHADRTRLKQVMINLLSNAIKYNRLNGAVIVRCEMSGKNRTRISVEDTGVGLSPEQSAQLFQSFNRLGREAGTEEGSGIGLVVTKQLVELMNGEVGVESRVGVGSTFWIELDATRAQELSIASGLASAVRNGGDDEPEQVAENALLMQRTILYVEDEPANLLLVQQLIAQRGDIKLFSAINGNQAIEMAHALRPDVILMDINLPGISGFDVMKILREDTATAHITVMALSANAMPLDVKKGLKAGFFRYLTKPIKIIEFSNELDAAFLNAAESSPSGENPD